MGHAAPVTAAFVSGATGGAPATTATAAPAPSSDSATTSLPGAAAASDDDATITGPGADATVTLGAAAPTATGPVRATGTIVPRTGAPAPGPSSAINAAAGDLVATASATSSGRRRLTAV